MPLSLFELKCILTRRKKKKEVPLSVKERKSGIFCTYIYSFTTQGGWLDRGIPYWRVTIISAYCLYFHKIAWLEKYKCAFM